MTSILDTYRCKQCTKLTNYQNSLRCQKIGPVSKVFARRLCIHYMPLDLTRQLSLYWSILAATNQRCIACLLSCTEVWFGTTYKCNHKNLEETRSILLFSTCMA